MERSTITTIDPFEIKLEYKDEIGDEFVTAAISIKVKDGLINQTALKDADRLKLAIEEWVEVVSVETYVPEPAGDEA